MYTVYLNLPCQTPFLLSTNCIDIFQYLKQKYGAYALDHREDERNYIPISVVKDQKDYIIETKGEAYSTSNPMFEIVQWINKCRQYDDSVFALHGAAVEWKGKADVFLAPTTSGKSTLTAYLTSQGCGYLSDDCVLLDRSDFNIHPHTTPIQLREGGYNLLKQLGGLLPTECFVDNYSRSPRYIFMPPTCITISMPLNRIFFIQRNEERNGIVPLSCIERINRLTKAPIIEYPINVSYLKIISKLAQWECSVLLYKDMDYIKKIVQG